MKKSLKELLENKEIKYKILSIKRRNWFLRTFSMSVSDWNVMVELEDKRILKLRCWAGWSEPNLQSLQWSIEDEIEKKITPKFETETLKLVDKTFKLE